MMRSIVWGLLILVVGVAVSLIALNSAVQSTSKYRFRLQVELDTPEGHKVGSSVVEVKVRHVTWGTPESKGIRRALRGEAIFLDMGGGKNLVATMTTGSQGEDEENRFERIAELSIQSATGVYPNPMKMSGQTGSFAVPKIAWPTLVTLSDVNDGFSAKAVDPLRLDAQFGKGTKVSSVTVSFTSDRPNYAIGRNLPFLHSQYKKLQKIYSYRPYIFKPQPYYFVRR